jgi:hypothetical protein
MAGFDAEEGCKYSVDSSQRYLHARCEKKEKKARENARIQFLTSLSNTLASRSKRSKAPNPKNRGASASGCTNWGAAVDASE